MASSPVERGHGRDGHLPEAARAESPFLDVAALLTGDAGLRIGEIRALEWERDIDVAVGTLTVNVQMRKGVIGTPKGWTRRTVPMIERLQHHSGRSRRSGAAVVRQNPFA